MALGANGGIRGIHRGVREDGPGRAAPGLGGVRSTDPMAGPAGIGRSTTCEILPVADLAGDQTPTRVGVGRHLGTQAVNRRIGKPWRGLVMTPGRHACGDAAAHPDNGDFMALRAGINTNHRLPSVSGHPACRMIVPVVLSRAGSPLAAATRQGREQGKAKGPQETRQPFPIPRPVHGNTQ